MKKLITGYFLNTPKKLDKKLKIIYNAFMIEKIEQLKDLNKRTKVEAKCEVCGKVFSMSAGSLLKKGKILCRTCSTKATNLERYGVEYISQVSEIREKAKATMIEKYGTENASQCPEIKEKMKQTNLERYGVEYASQSSKIKEKVKSTNLEKLGVEYPGQSEKVKEKMKQTNLERYGVKAPLQSEKVKEKMKQTNLERYGVKNVFQSEEIKEKIKTVNLERYGVENPLQNEKIKEKVKSTNLEKYGTICPLQNEKIIIKSKKTNLEKYGVSYASQSEEVKEKIKVANLEKYGVPCASQSEEVKEKIKTTCVERYGVPYIFQNKKFREKSKATCIERYGVAYTSQNPDIKKKIFSHREMSSPEKKMDEFLRNRGFTYQYEYECNGKNFDFAIFKEDKLAILLEIDGEYFHGLLSDYDGHHVQGMNDCIRFSKVPDGVKFIVCDSLNIEKAFSEIVRVFDLDYENWITEIISSLPNDFPFPTYSDRRMKLDYERLKEFDNFISRARIGDSIIRNFHKSIWTSKVGNHISPYEAWNNRELLEKSVRNRVIYSSSLSTQSILNGFNVSKIAPKVSVFSATLAKNIIKDYLDEYNEIFDPFSGFSGRMLGACACGKKYIGQDINENHINEANLIKDYLGLNAELTQKDIFESEGSYECLFTCPPYNLKEDWGNENQKNLSCDDWIDECLKRFKCKTYIFVVDETEKYKDFIINEISNESYFSNSIEKIVAINAL